MNRVLAPRQSHNGGWVAHDVDSDRDQVITMADAIKLKATKEWLGKEEVLYFLKNWKTAGFPESFAPPSTPPPSGTLLLYNKLDVRNFRRDNHCWRKKTDGVTVSETHEKLKINDVPALNCYYAHAMVEGGVQRRSYWMLTGDSPYVLVHYLALQSGRLKYPPPKGSGSGPRAATRVSTRRPKERKPLSDDDTYDSSPSPPPRRKKRAAAIGKRRASAPDGIAPARPARRKAAAAAADDEDTQTEEDVEMAAPEPTAAAEPVPTPAPPAVDPLERLRREAPPRRARIVARRASTGATDAALGHAAADAQHRCDADAFLAVDLSARGLDAETAVDRPPELIVTSGLARPEGTLGRPAAPEDGFEGARRAARRHSAPGDVHPLALPHDDCAQEPPIACSPPDAVVRPTVRAQHLIDVKLEERNSFSPRRIVGERHAPPRPPRDRSWLLSALPSSHAPPTEFHGCKVEPSSPLDDTLQELEKILAADDFPELDPFSVDLRQRQWHAAPMARRLTHDGGRLAAPEAAPPAGVPRPLPQARRHSTAGHEIAWAFKGVKPLEPPPPCRFGGGSAWARDRRERTGMSAYSSPRSWAPRELCDRGLAGGGQPPPESWRPRVPSNARGAWHAPMPRADPSPARVRLHIKRKDPPRAAPAPPPAAAPLVISVCAAHARAADDMDVDDLSPMSDDRDACDFDLTRHAGASNGARGASPPPCSPRGVGETLTGSPKRPAAVPKRREVDDSSSDSDAVCKRLRSLSQLPPGAATAPPGGDAAAALLVRNTEHVADGRSSSGALADVLGEPPRARVPGRSPLSLLAASPPAGASQQPLDPLKRRGSDSCAHPCSATRSVTTHHDSPLLRSRRPAPLNLSGCGGEPWMPSNDRHASRDEAAEGRASRQAAGRPDPLPPAKLPYGAPRLESIQGAEATTTATGGSIAHSACTIDMAFGRHQPEARQV